MLWDTVFSISEDMRMKASKPIFLELSNRIVTDICRRYLTKQSSALKMKSDCNGKGDRKWVGNKNIPNIKKKQPLS